MHPASLTNGALHDRLTLMVSGEAWRSPVERHLARLGLELQSGSPTYVRARPPEMALVGFRVHVAGAADPLLGYIGLLPDWRVEQALEQMRHWRHGRLVDHMNADPEEGCLVCTLPADRRLRGAATVVDRAMLAKSIRRSLPRGANSKLRTHAAQTYSTPVSYKPERRLVCRVATEVGEGERSTLKLYARSYADPRAGRAVEEARALFQAAHLASHVRLSEPLGWDQRGYVAYFREVDGRSFDDLDPGAARVAWYAAGRALAGIHRLSPHVEWVLDARTATHRLETTLQGLSFASPEAGERALRLSHAMLTALPSVRTSSLVHGDFYSKQLLWDGERVALLDYDELAAGDPAADLANCLAHVEARNIPGALSAHAVRDALMSGYARAGAELPTATTLRWFGAWALLELSVWPFRSLAPDYAARCGALVTLAEAAWRGEGVWGTP